MTRLVLVPILAFGLSACDGGTTEPKTEAPPVPTTVTISPPSVTLEALGAIAQFSATVKDQSGKEMSGEGVTWHTGNESIASIDAGGFATAEGVGFATITANVGSASGTASVTVDQAVVWIGVTPVSATLTGPEQTLQLSAEATDANSHPMEGAVFTWTSSDPGCAFVDAAGMVTSGVEGIATVTATSGGIGGTAEITVLPPPVATVEVTPSSGNILVGGRVQFTAVTKAASGAILSGREIAWRSFDSLKASVDQSGLVTGNLVGGPVAIMAVSEGMTGESQVTVQEFMTVTSLLGDKDGFGLGLEPGDERPISETMFDSREPDDPTFTDMWKTPADFTYTHTFEVPDGGTVSSATIRWLTLGVQDGDSQVSGSDTDIVLDLDGVEVPGAFDSVDQFRHNGTSWVGTVGLVEIPLIGPVLETLQDGEVEVRLQILQLGSITSKDAFGLDFSEMEVIFH